MSQRRLSTGNGYHRLVECGPCGDMTVWDRTVWGVGAYQASYLDLRFDTVWLLNESQQHKKERNSLLPFL